MKPLSLAAFLLFVGPSFAQTYIAAFIGDKLILPHVGPMTGFTQGTWGYFSLDGTKLIKPTYDKATPFCAEGLAVADVTPGRWRIIDTENNEIELPIASWEPVNYFGNGASPFSDGMLVIKSGKNFGVVNTKGEVVFDLVYQHITPFNEGAAIGRLGKVHYILTPDGERLETPSDFKDPRKFKDGLLPYQNAKGLLGFMNMQGVTVVEPRFQNVGYYFNGFAWARTPEDKMGILDAKGNWLVEPRFDRVMDFNAHDAATSAMLGTECFVVTSSGEVIPVPNAIRIWEFSSGLAPVRIGEMHGYVNTRGEIVIEPVYEAIKPFESGFGAVRMATKWGLINPEGKVIAEPIYDKIGEASEGIMPLLKEGLWTFVNQEGVVILGPKYVDYRPFKNGFAAVRDANGKWGFINAQGEEVVAPQFEDVRDFVRLN